MNSQCTASPQSRPHAPHNVTLTSEHVIQTPDQCNDKKPQVHGFGKLCCNPYKHLGRELRCVQRGAGNGRSHQAQRSPACLGRDPSHSTTGTPHPLERKPTGNLPQPFSTAEVLLQLSLLNLWLRKENEDSKFRIGTETVTIQVGLESVVLRDFKTKGEQIKWLEKQSQTHRDVLFRHSAKCHPTVSHCCASMFCLWTFKTEKRLAQERQASVMAFKSNHAKTQALLRLCCFAKSRRLSLTFSSFEKRMLQHFL